METTQFDIGIIGLGVMGRNLALNMASHGFSVAGYDQDPVKAGRLSAMAGEMALRGFDEPNQFLQRLTKPRKILLMVPAGNPVDEVLHMLMPYLLPGELVIDGGNSHYPDTERRATQLAREGVLWLGTGISGGEEGARTGPSLMPGGSQEGYERVKHIFEAIAAKVQGTPCVGYLGKGSAGHFVKMVHNGIEYAMMQLISETYHLARRLGHYNSEQLYQLFREWNEGKLQSFLIEITASIFRQPDPFGPGILLDYIADQAGQKGTGKWTTQAAMDLGVPIPCIDTAVTMRQLSGNIVARQAANQLVPPPPVTEPVRLEASQLEGALYFSFLMTFSQGLALIAKASEAYQYGISMATVPKLWKGGCIIRAAMLEKIVQALEEDPDSPRPLFAMPNLAEEAQLHYFHAQAVAQAAVASATPMPCTLAAISYYDAFRAGQLPMNLIQAQRDFFGAHTYHRTDRPGTFHTEWKF